MVLWHTHCYIKRQGYVDQIITQGSALRGQRGPARFGDLENAWTFVLEELEIQSQLCALALRLVGYPDKTW